MSLTALNSNDLQDAEKFTEAAWQLAQEPVAGDRLAQVYEKQDKLSLALETYKLAKPYPKVPRIPMREKSSELSQIFLPIVSRFR